MFKENYNAEEYLIICQSRRQLSLLAHFRLEIFPLHIETERYKSKDESECVCNLCKSGNIKNEFHVLCKCNVYCNLTEVLYRYIAQSNNKM